MYNFIILTLYFCVVQYIFLFHTYLPSYPHTALSLPTVLSSSESAASLLYSLVCRFDFHTSKDIIQYLSFPCLIYDGHFLPNAEETHCHHPGTVYNKEFMELDSALVSENTELNSTLLITPSWLGTIDDARLGLVAGLTQVLTSITWHLILALAAHGVAY